MMWVTVKYERVLKTRDEEGDERAGRIPRGRGEGSMVCVSGASGAEAVLWPLCWALCCCWCCADTQTTETRRKRLALIPVTSSVSPKRQLSEADAAEMGFLGIDVLSRPVHRGRVW